MAAARVAITSHGRCAGGDYGDEHEVTPGLAPAGRMLAEARSSLGAEG
jgi:hypothetical protein